MHNGCTPFDSRLQIRCFLQEREYIPCPKIMCATSNPFFKINCIHDGCIHLIQACQSVVSCRRKSIIFHVQKFCVLLAYNPYFKCICLHEYLCIDLIQTCKSYVSCKRSSILHIPKLCALLASNSSSLSKLFPSEFWFVFVKLRLIGPVASLYGFKSTVYM
jgi:hypothetical protein